MGLQIEGPCIDRVKCLDFEALTEDISVSLQDSFARIARAC